MNNSSSFKRTFLTGLAVLFPILITAFLLIWFYGLLDRTIGTGVNGVFKSVLVANPTLFDKAFPAAASATLVGPNGEALTGVAFRTEYADLHFPSVVGTVVGIIGTLIVVYVLGVLIRGYMAKKVVGGVDRFFERFPIVKSIYPHARQAGDVLFGADGGKSFRRVVALQWPRRGVYTLGFVTGEGIKDIEAHAGQDLLTVLVPHSPTPLTGFLVLVPRDEVIDLAMTVEQALSFVMTAGMVAAEGQRTVEDARGNRIAVTVPAEGPGARVDETGDVVNLVKESKH